MISSKQDIVTGGQFSQNHYHRQVSVGNKVPIDILTDAVAPSSFHDSGARFDPSKCHPRTRVQILAKIMRWIVGQDEENRSKPFMWLSGAAGCGKSAIAQSTVELCLEQGILLASFFFNRTDHTRNTAESLVATLAYQLYYTFPETEVQLEILSAIKKDPLIFKRTIQRQFTSLTVQPLAAYLSKDSSTQRRTPFLIMIDGLDECKDCASQKSILTGLADSVRSFPTCIRVFIASRPEHNIKLSFVSKCLKGVYTHLTLDMHVESQVYLDIKLYLSDRFAENTGRLR
ncbi:hypothetical protein D9613_012012 [Agrocybe pediades]|uniref:Nephrocystin 3-like N-terminal domain-containing protein n=1 Tax=Agrocybe pediades TaxID=84607 RepID=A0A8H4QF61_9AGAR|nr:hypothetical protein D9613_012012 [Agrocybe pediades]